MVQATTAEFEVFCPGILDVLSIGKGDLRLSVGDNDEDRERARALIEEMLEKGYAIFVETDEGPVRVNSFNPHRMTYVILDAPETEPAETPAKKTPSRSGKSLTKTAKKRGRREVAVAGSRATAVGRTAGG